MMLEYEFEVSCAESMYFYCFVCRHGRVKRTPHELGDLRVSTGVTNSSACFCYSAQRRQDILTCSYILHTA